VFSKSADYGFRGADSGFPELVRETLSKNAMLPGLTYFYCNWVSQAEREALGCGVGKEESNGVGCSAGPFAKSARRGAPPVISGNVKRQTRAILRR
jgi:hypothetical protein